MKEARYFGLDQLYRAIELVEGLKFRGIVFATSFDNRTLQWEIRWNEEEIILENK